MLTHLDLKAEAPVCVSLRRLNRDGLTLRWRSVDGSKSAAELRAGESSAPLHEISILDRWKIGRAESLTDMEFET